MDNSIDIEKIKEIEDQDLYTAYFGKNADYYLKRLARINSGESFILNPYAFFLGILWFAYRKMFDVVVFFIGFIVLELAVVETFFSYADTTIYDRFVNIICSVVLGGFANYWYMRTIKIKIESAKSMYSRREDMITYLEQKGGTNLAYPFVLLGIFVVFIVFSIFYLDLD